MSHPGPYLRVVNGTGRYQPYGSRTTAELLVELGALREMLASLESAQASGELPRSDPTRSLMDSYTTAIRDLDAEIRARQKGA